MQLFDQEKSQSSQSDQSHSQGNYAITSATGFVPVLQNRRFLLLWLGQIFSQIADKVYLVLMIALVSSYFQQPGQPISRWVSPIMIAFTIPAVLFGSLAGVFVDRWSKKQVLVVSNLGRGILVLSLPFLLERSPAAGVLGLPIGFWAMLLVTLLVSTLTQFFAPAEQATIPLIVQKNDLLPANSLYTTTMMVVLIVGFAVGEPLLAIANRLAQTWGAGGGRELLVGGSYALAGLLLGWLKTGEGTQHRDQSDSHPFADVRDGLNYLHKNDRVRNALIQLVILFSVFAALAVLAVSLADQISGIDADQFGILLAAGGIGMAIGAAIVGQIGSRFKPSVLSLWGSMGMAGALVGLSIFTSSLVGAGLMTIVLGIFAALVGVPMQTTIQSETPPAMRGKVFGLQNNAVNIALSLPLVLAGVAEARLGLSAVFLILAALALAGGGLSWYIAGLGQNPSKV